MTARVVLSRVRMELRPFGHTEREVSVIGHGTWRIDERERNLAIAALHRSLELGMTHIDTAEMYGDAENIVGEAIEGRRDQVFLVSKVLPRTPRAKGRSRLRKVARSAQNRLPRLLPFALARLVPTRGDR